MKDKNDMMAGFGLGYAAGMLFLFLHLLFNGEIF
jgi:hypothetical protein